MILRYRNWRAKPLAVARFLFAVWFANNDGWYGLMADRGGCLVQRLTRLPSPDQIREHVQAIFSEDPEKELASTQMLRRFLSFEHNPPIDQVIDAGALPRLVEFLNRHGQPKLQWEAASALASVVSGSSQHVHAVVEAAAVPVLINLLSSPVDYLRAEVVWVVGRMAEDSIQVRDFLLQSGALQPVLDCLTDATKPDLLRTAVWALSSLHRGRPRPPLQAVKSALPHVARLLSSSDDADVLANACWTLSCISDDAYTERIQAVVEAGVVPRLVQLLAHGDQSVVIPAVRTVGNLVTGDDVQTQVVVDAGVLPALGNLLAHRERSVRKEVCWTVSNITAGTRQQIQAVMDAGLFPRLVRLLGDPEPEVQKEAIWAIANAASGGTNGQIAHLVHQGVIPRLCDLLDRFGTDSRMAAVTFDGLQRILDSGDCIRAEKGIPNPYVSMMKACGATELLERLANHPEPRTFCALLAGTGLCWHGTC